MLSQATTVPIGQVRDGMTKTFVLFSSMYKYVCYMYKDQSI